MAREISTVGVVGLGTMGSGIVEVLARAGVQVVAVEQDDVAVAAGRARVTASTGRAVAAGTLSMDDEAALAARVSYTTAITGLASADLVVEAVPEDLEAKRAVLAALDDVVGPDAVLATATASLSVTELAVSTRVPGRVVGTRFANPATERQLVEVVRPAVADADVVDAVTELVGRLGKVATVVGDRTGFITGALLFGYLNHAVSMYESRYATRDDIDAAMRLGCGLPMGPLAVVDLIGVDATYQVLDSMYRRDGSRVHAPSPLLKQMVAAGLNGRKSGQGFYTYAEPGSPAVVADTEAAASTPAETAARPVQRVGVVGSGTMATGIIEVFAKAGYDVVFVARSAEKAAKVVATVTKSLDKAVARGKLDEPARDATLARLTGTAAMGDLADVDLVVEAVVEDLTVKTDLFRELDGICKPGAVLATTTSSLPIVECAMATSRPQDVVGMHFFNPATVMRLVEVVDTVSTADDVVATAVAVSRRLGKHPVTCGDRAGFIVNALLFPYLNDAVRMLESHYATTEEIDAAVKAGLGYPMGPFQLMDVVGTDVSLAIERELHLEFHEPDYAPATLLAQLVEAGYLGRKSGRGFHTYG